MWCNRPSQNKNWFLHETDFELIGWRTEYSLSCLWFGSNICHSSSRFSLVANTSGVEVVEFLSRHVWNWELMFAVALTLICKKKNIAIVIRRFSCKIACTCDDLFAHEITQERWPICVNPIRKNNTACKLWYLESRSNPFLKLCTQARWSGSWCALIDGWQVRNQGREGKGVWWLTCTHVHLAIYSPIYIAAATS